MTTPKIAFQRVLLKLSGESLMGSQSYGIDPDTLSAVSEELRGIHSLGVELGVVVGGGNIFRGLKASESGMDRVTGDHMGMLATVLNALALADALRKHEVRVRVMTAIPMGSIAERFVRDDALQALGAGEVVVFAAGTGNPFFTTDTAAALRGVEIGAEALLKATRVDGVYNADPETDPDAQLIEEVSFQEALERRLRVLDSTAFSLCRDNDLPIHVLNLNPPGNIQRLVQGERIGSIVR